MSRELIEQYYRAFNAADYSGMLALLSDDVIHDINQGTREVGKLKFTAFLKHMVRNLVGTLVYVGKGKHPPQWVAELLNARDRAKAAPTFGPQGLYLETIEYQPRWGLPL